ncbi:hypothetical protein [Rhodovulum sulfidophilum]|uniref:hypothetical protein n=1 Tax=Rhodovulum sulfidophilum TaxID=35806 RepID=UPI00117B4398|nr:hypothetical protein [Rhodovulum sulfidophilum]
MIDYSEVTAGNETLMRQAPMTAEEYLHAAIDSIDKCFGEGFAKEHPELFSSFLNTCALDAHTSFVTRTLEKVAGELGRQADAFGKISQGIEKLGNK